MVVVDVVGGELDDVVGVVIGILFSTGGGEASSCSGLGNPSGGSGILDSHRLLPPPSRNQGGSGFSVVVVVVGTHP